MSLSIHAPNKIGQATCAEDPMLPSYKTSWLMICGLLILGAFAFVEHKTENKLAAAEAQCENDLGARRFSHVPRRDPLEGAVLRKSSRRDTKPSRHRA